jgi:ferric-chelate reductase [NAD(P)H]
MTSTIDINVLSQIHYGVFIITSCCQTKINGQIATVAFQITSKPAQVITCINKENLTHELILANKVFGVSILTEDADLKFIGKFGFCSGRMSDKFCNINYKTLSTGTPLVIDHTAGIMDLKVNQAIDVGTHTLFVGELVASEKLCDKQPMTYDYYHKVIKGKTHKNAPTFQITQ